VGKGCFDSLESGNPPEIRVAGKRKFAKVSGLRAGIEVRDC
jgi:hypothetical protein